jgi:hypothetical protein
MKNLIAGLFSTVAMTLFVWAAPPDSPPSYEELTTGLGIGILYEPCIGNDRDGNLNDLYITEYGDEIEKNGFKSVRLRLSMDAFTDNSTGTYPNQQLTRDFFDGPTGMTYVIDDLLSRHNGTMYVLISPKGLENGTADDATQQAIWWGQVAEEYKDYTHRLIFNLMNEPLIRDGEYQDMNAVGGLYQALTDAIRPTNPTRYLVYHRMHDEVMNGTTREEHTPFSETGPGKYDFNHMSLPTNHNGYLLFDVHFLGDEDTAGNGEGKRDERLRHAWEFREVTGYPVWSGAWNWGAWDTAWSTTEVTELVQLMKDKGIPGTYLMFNSSNTSIYDGNGTDRDGDTVYNEWTKPEYLPIVPARNPIFWQKNQIHPVTMYAPVHDGTADSTGGLIDAEGGKDMQVDANGTKVAYVKFDVCRLPAGSITGAKLRFKVRTANNDTISVHLADSNNWDESDADGNSVPGLDWASAPSYGSALDSVVVNTADPATTLDSAVNDNDWIDPNAYTHGSWYEVDVSSAITSTGVYTFAFTGSNNMLTEIYTRDTDGTIGTTGIWKYYPRLEVTVNPSAAANNAPTFSGATLTKANATPSVPYSGSISGDASDTNGDSLRYGGYGPCWLTIKQDGTLVGTPSAADSGVNTWTVEVTDAKGGTDTATLEITVGAAGTAPYFLSDPVSKSSAYAGIAYSDTLDGTAADPNSDPLTFSLTSAQDWLYVASDGTLSGTPATNDVGTNTFTVQVSDGSETDTATLKIVVLDGAVSQTFNALEDAYGKESKPTTNYGSSSLLELRQDGGAGAFARVSYLKFNVSGLSGDILSARLKVYSTTETDTLNALSVSDNTWTEGGLFWDNRPATGSVLGSAQAAANSWVTIDLGNYIVSNGTYTIALDEQGDTLGNLSSSEGANVPYLEITTYDNNTAPAFSSDPFSKPAATFSQAYSGTLTGSATDADGDELTYSLASTQGWLYVAADGTLSGTPSFSDLGTNTFTVQVSDGTASDSATLTIEVVDGSSSASFTVSADTFVRAANPDSNYGFWQKMDVRKVGGFAPRAVYLKFDVSGITEAISSAKLHVYSLSCKNPIKAYELSNSWDEGTVTWNLLPPSLLNEIGSGTAATGSWFTIDLTASGYITSNGTYSIALDEQADAWAQLATKENADQGVGTLAAYLEVSYGGESAYDEWASGESLAGNDAEQNADPDTDDARNLIEYALGGDPNIADDGVGFAGMLKPVVTGSGVEFVYPKRKDAAIRGLVYTVETCENISGAAWSNANVSVTGSGSLDADFDAVTNRVSTDGAGKRFFRLFIEQR